MRRLFLVFLLGIILINSLSFIYAENVATYNFAVCTRLTNCSYYVSDVDVFPFASSTANRNTYVLQTAGNHTSLSALDSNIQKHLNMSDGDEVFQWYRFKVNEDVDYMSNLNFTFVGNATGASTFSIWVLRKEGEIGTNYAINSNWTQVGATQSIGNTETSFTRNLSSGFANYINDSGWITWAVYQAQSGKFIYTNYIEMNVSYLTDNSGPSVDIIVPLNNTNWSTNTLDINYTATDNFYLSNCWYSNDSYSINISLGDCSTNITGITWAEGQHNITVWANDTSGNENHSTVFFTVDTTSPNIAIVYPSNNTNTSNTNLNVNYTVSDTGLGVGSCWYSNDSYSKNTSLPNCGNITTITWAEGAHEVRIYTNDTLGNINYSDISFTIDTAVPVINVSSPLQNARYNSQQIQVNFTATDSLSSISTLWFYNGTENITFTGGLVYQNLEFGNHTFTFYANDTASNMNKTNVTFTVNGPPNITSLYAYPSPIKGGNVININSSMTDPNNDSLNFYCSEASMTPDATNTNCTGGSTNGNAPYNLSCTYSTAADDTVHTVYCRAYDGYFYSGALIASYTTDSASLTTSIVSVAGDTTPSYVDAVNDDETDILISGENGMSCRWSSNNIVYSSMSNDCEISGTQANCSVNNALTEGFITRYVSCKDSLGNEQNTSQNLDVDFYLDYTAPTTSDNSNTSIHTPPYTVTITEADNVDGDPTTKYCTSSSQGCDPTTNIDNGGQITYTSLNRGANYLRYYSTDFAGNTQIVVNKTININQFPTFTSAVDNATTIRGGRTVKISTNSSDVDSGQIITLYVCNSSGATSSGCSGRNYCNATGTANLSCSFTSESDSAYHTWYAYIFDELGEEAAANPLTGSYTTDSTAPVITLTNPLNGSTVTQNSITIMMVVNEVIRNAWYSLDSGKSNVSMSNISVYLYTHSNTSIANGVYNLSIWVNDTYEDIGSLLGNSFTINSVSGGDTTAPVITILSPSNASYNNPNSVLINITSNEDLNWAGYKLNSGALIGLTSTTATNWNITLSGLSQETVYNLTVYANDTSNNQANKTIIFYTDTLAPRFSSTSATPSNANVSQAVNCSVVWQDGFNITNVKISENSAGVYENHTISFSGTSGSVSYNIIGSKLTNVGTYTCTFYAIDTAGNVNSTSVSFNVSDVTAPTIIVTSPSNSTYNQINIEISIVTSETASWAGYSLDGTANVTMGNTSSTAWNKTLTGLAETGHTIIFYANDSSGNMANSSMMSFAINTGVTDTTPPVITITTLSNGSYYTNTTLELNITTNENSSSAFYILNSGVSVYMSNSSTLNWNATLSGLGEESTNILEVYANDTSLNTGNTSITFYVDTLAPRFTEMSTIPDTANETQNVICNIYVNDTFSLASVKIGENSTIPGVFLNHTTDLSSAGYANYTILNVQKGTYTCMFYATDAAGNTDSTYLEFDVIDVTAPVITVNSPSNQSYSTNSILLSITLNENVTEANYSLDGGATNLSLTGSGKSWSKTITLSDGNHTVEFYAVDSYGNIGANSVSFSTDISVYDSTLPTIAIWSPVNETYYTNGTALLLNISSDESLSWAGYSNNSNIIYDMGNISATNWNATIDLWEGRHNLTFYANDSSSNKNRANSSITIYVDLNNPSIGSFNCTNPANNSENVIFNASVSDAIGLSYYIVGSNATGSWINSSQINLSAASIKLNYTILAANTSPGSFGVELYLYDLSGRANISSYIVNVSDDTRPRIFNFTYLPNTTAELDPDVTVMVNATIVEDYNISSVYLMWMNLSDGIWRYTTMSNNSALVERGSSTIVYNASFVSKNGTYSFRINATDSAGNWNISANYTIVVENETSFWNSTTIPDIKSFTVLQAAGNNSLGILYLNNTGDDALNFNITLTSTSLGTRLSVNYTLNQTMSYSVSSKGNLSLSIEVNTTGLAVNTYNYNITVSSAAGTTVFSKQLSIQSLAAPYIVASITKYSSSVTKGQTGIELIASVSNYGTQDATGVYLNWTLPSTFSLSSGSLSRNIGNLPIGSTSTNTITFSVSSSAADSVVNIFANATASGSLSSSDYKEVTIGSPITVIVIVPGGGGVSVGGGGGAAKAIAYDKEIDVTRGKETQFDIEIHNPHTTSKLEDLTIRLTGYLEQYISVSPSIILSIGYNETKAFTVKLSAPSYKGYEEYDLQAVITGKLNDGKSVSDYSETKWIKVTIQEISAEEVQEKFGEAEKAISEMKQSGFYTVQVEKVLADADGWLKERKYQKSSELLDNIIRTKETAFEADDLLRRVIESMKNPSKNNLIVGNIIRNLGGYDTKTPLRNLLTGRSIFASSSTEDIVNLGIAAFERGDFDSALERAKEARESLILERKGNFLLFIYLYWYYILFFIMLVLGTGVAGYRKYQKMSITKRIGDLNSKEDNLRNLGIKEQKEYFAGKISPAEYNAAVKHHQKELAELKKSRSTLGNIRIKMLMPQQIVKDLEKENKEVEENIKNLQKQFYKDKKISEKEYKVQFEAMNSRFAEIEDEKTTLELLNKKEVKKFEGIKIKNIFSLIKRIPQKIIRKISKKDKRGIVTVDNNLVETLKKHTKNKDCRKKWVKLNLKNRGKNEK